jgi:hypothetical protein
MSFDLNINNYSVDELKEMFDLPTNFDNNILDIKESKLKDSIINNKEINKETQIQTLNFLIKAKNIILGSQNENKKENSEFNNKLLDFYNSSYKLKPIKVEDPEEHMVQERTNKPYLSSFPSEFFPGIINPLKKRTIKKNLNIDSRFRENYYNSSASDFHVNLPTYFSDVIQIQLANIEFPSTFFVFSKQYGNNFFTINLTNTNGTFSEVINILDGNYDQNTIMDMINHQLTNLGVTVDSDFGHIVFTINLTNGITGSGQTLVGFDGTQTAGSTFELNFQVDRSGIDDRNTPLPLKLGWILGFRNGIYTNNNNYVSESVVDVTGPRYIYLVVDDHNNNVNNGFFSAFNSSILNKNVLARVSLQSNTFNLLSQNNLGVVTTPREYFGPINLQILNIQLLDEYGRILDLNNMDFSFCLTLTTIYDI